MTRPAHLALAVALAALLAACGAASENGAAPTAPAAPAAVTGSGTAPDDPAAAEEAPGAVAPSPGIPVGLLLRVLRIERPGAPAEVAPGLVTLRLDADGALGGTLGCNAWSGRWLPDDATVPAQALTTTAVGCPPPADWVPLADLLAAGVAVVPVAGGVELRAADGSTAVAVPLDLAPLVAGRRFALAATLALGGERAAADARATIRLDADGYAHGRLGCSAWAGTWRATGEQLALDVAIVLPGGCERPDVDGLRGLLDRPLAVEIGRADELALALVDADGRGLRFALDDRPPAHGCGADLPPDAAWTGLSLADANDRAAAAGLELRLACVDGEAQVLRADLRRDRVNLDVVDGRVVGVGRF